LCCGIILFSIIIKSCMMEKRLNVSGRSAKELADAEAVKPQEKVDEFGTQSYYDEEASQETSRGYSKVAPINLANVVPVANAKTKTPQGYVT
jgi:hypothetical protein